ncbi:hypothetical protein L861_01340 [Litchfieldella anticariensis FP35 = DSM 16096]|uniref:Allene oxide cyclase barrel-like domain-containing protein n=1 Tax=Litchfieldella anticariensis (strain DSM 16096 / CECT 5854 / CIP 108499 / LMG 22089 / FP35) TaxID=1121939 RepID=S2L837_LITA3|nr:hypothetical protein [Halomonas anticariensis]EPC03974.1 hypothetical protein L861_01340 [Halomonas anticariensis FP35 = DSM 16096]
MKKHQLTQGLTKTTTIMACLGAFISSAAAEPIKIEAAVSPTEQIRHEFADDSNRIVQMVKREGEATGSGPLAQTAVTEYGFHDVVPGMNGDATGYLVFTTSENDVAYVKWLLRAVFVPGADDKPMLLDNGVWEVVGGSGKFEGLEGAGIIHIEFVSQTDRSFILEGEMVSAQE